MTVPHNAASAWLRRIWRALPDGPLTEWQLDSKILKIEVPDPNGWRGDFARAGALRSALVSCGAVRLDRDAEGAVVYMKAATFPEQPQDSGPGSPGFNEYLRKVSEAEREEMRRLDETRAAEFANSPLGIQRDQILALIRQEQEPLKAELQTLRAEIARLTQVAA